MAATSVTTSANIPTSLKLPRALKLQLEEDAQQMGMSLHAFMVNTLADAAQRKRLRQTFAQDSADALAVMKATGKGHALDDVRLYFSQLKEHRQGQSAPPAPLQPKKMG
jgi:HipA-like protein